VAATSNEVPDATTFPFDKTEDLVTLYSSVNFNPKMILASLKAHPCRVPTPPFCINFGGTGGNGGNEKAVELIKPMGRVMAVAMAGNGGGMAMHRGMKAAKDVS